MNKIMSLQTAFKKAIFVLGIWLAVSPVFLRLSASKTDLFLFPAKF